MKWALPITYLLIGGASAIYSALTCDTLRVIWLWRNESRTIVWSWQSIWWKNGNCKRKLDNDSNDFALYSTMYNIHCTIEHYPNIGENHQMSMWTHALSPETLFKREISCVCVWHRNRRRDVDVLLRAWKQATFGSVDLPGWVLISNWCVEVKRARSAGKQMVPSFFGHTSHVATVALPLKSTVNAKPPFSYQKYRERFAKNGQELKTGLPSGNAIKYHVNCSGEI